jgi:hypothetical protein
MSERIIDKRTLKLLKDAVIRAKDHLREYYSEVQEGKYEEPAGLARQFGQVRRLHRYFSNLAELGARTFPMDLGEEEENLLASCLVHYLPSIDHEVAKPNQPPSHVKFMKEIQNGLIILVKSLVTRPIQPILDPRPLASQSPSVRSLLGFVPGLAEKTEKIQSFEPKNLGMFTGSIGIEGLYSVPEGSVQGDRRMQSMGGIVGGRRKEDRDSLEEGKAEERVHRHPLVGILDPSMIKDHRMRALIKLDLTCLERSMGMGDFRMSLVHFGSILEGILVDFGLRNRKKLNLIESPDRWDLMKIAEELLGDKAFDEPIVGILLGCNRLLRPSRMLVNPMIITKEMVDDAKTILSWILAEMGLKGSSDQAPCVDDSGCHEPPETSGIWRATRR